MSEFSWKRGIKHALIPFLLVIVAGIVLAMVLDVKDPEKLGEGCGRLGFVVGLVGLGASYCVQTGKRVLGAVLGVGVIALIGGVVVAVVLGYRSVHAFSPGDRTHLVEVEREGGTWLRHPTLGFELRHPGPAFREVPEVAAMMAAKDTESIYYGYVDDSKTAVLIIGVKPGGFAEREDVEKTFDGVIHGMATTMGSPHIVSREANEHDGTLHVTMGDTHFRARLLSVIGPDSYALMIMVGSPSADALAPVLASARGPF